MANSSPGAKKSSVDALIAGGGLAGMTLALQLKRQHLDLDIVVVERDVFPKPEKILKVGESTVEIGSHYLSEVLALKPHFEQHQLRKNGLRCFFGTPASDFSQQDELGTSRHFGIPAYQIDRGVLENHLYRTIVAEGVRVIDGATIEQFEVGQRRHQLCVNSMEGPLHFTANWVLDAAGRQALLKRHLKLEKSTAHKGNALWFRVDRQIKLDDWSTDESWQQRTAKPRVRWLSTNHLMGPGYWVWIIPLSTGATSIGIVLDDQALNESGISDLHSTLVWLEKEQPVCAQAIAGATVLDFVLIRDYAYDCSRMFSDQGWGLSGEAGVFADPFYSPGSDFIAINNTLLSSLVADAKNGADIRLKSAVFQSMAQGFFENTLSLYTGQYGGWGDRRLMSAKLVWDYAYYWGVLSLLFFRSAMADIPLMRALNPLLADAKALNAAVQAAFRQRAAQRLVLPARGVFMDQYEVPVLRHFNDVLKMSPPFNIQSELADNTAKLAAMAKPLLDMVSEQPASTVSSGERALFGDYRQTVLA